MLVVTTEIEDLRLVWPAALFVEEASTLLAYGYAGDVSAVRLLFSEAFAAGVGASLVREVCETMSPYRGKWQPNASTADPWEPVERVRFGASLGPSRSRQLLEEVVRRVECSEVATFAPKRYWSARQQTRADSGPPLSSSDLRRSFIDLLRELDQMGYFDPEVGPDCCDADVDRDAEGAAALERLWGKQVPWPLAEGGDDWLSSLSDDDFLDLIEVFYDLVQRPRTSRWHSFCEEWDYGDHDARAGQRVYTWRINAILESSDWDLRMSEAPEDAGLLVRTVPDDRAQLPDTVAQAAKDSAERERIEHAGVLQRSRRATRQTRRDAARSLADVLENRRPMVKELLGNKDESNLFQIINSFDIRHMNKLQQSQFGDEFFDYFYWTFLASLDLMDKLEMRRAGEAVV